MRWGKGISSIGVISTIGAWGICCARALIIILILPLDFQEF